MNSHTIDNAGATRAIQRYPARIGSLPESEASFSGTEPHAFQSARQLVADVVDRTPSGKRGVPKDIERVLHDLRTHYVYSDNECTVRALSELANKLPTTELKHLALGAAKEIEQASAVFTIAIEAARRKDLGRVVPGAGLTFFSILAALPTFGASLGVTALGLWILKRSVDDPYVDKVEASLLGELPIVKQLIEKLEKLEGDQ